MYVYQNRFQNRYSSELTVGNYLRPAEVVNVPVDTWFALKLGQEEKYPGVFVYTIFIDNEVKAKYMNQHPKVFTNINAGVGLFGEDDYFRVASGSHKNFMFVTHKDQ